MSKNEIVLSIKIDDNNTLKVTQQQAEKTAKSVNKISKSTNDAAKSRDHYSKRDKGVAQATSNSTKAFSKQAQSLGSGLVPAYAALAANIFAVTAAFGALRRAAGTEQLAKGLEYVGTSAGKNLPKVVKNLREITDAAISTQTAMESVALGVSAGFSTTQMEELTRVAKGASLALGRDMGDAMSRLTRGAAKLEPEILDELGIMVRLDDVAREYSATLGKTANELTQFERRMAFTNAIIDQGTKKFGDISKAIDANPYDKMAATFSDLTKSGLNLINTVLGPLAGFFGNNASSLLGGLIIFGATVTKQMVPAMYEASEAAATAAKEASALATNNLEAALSNESLSKSSEKAMRAAAEGTDVHKNLNKVISNQTKSVNLNAAQLEGWRKEGEKSNAQLKTKANLLKAARVERTKTAKVLYQYTTAQIKSNDAAAIELASTGQYKKAFSTLKTSIYEYAAAGKVARANMTGLAAANNLAATSAKIAAVSFKTAGTALLTVLPYIGMITIAFGALKGVYDKFFGDSNLEKATKEAAESFDSLLESSSKLSNVMESNASSAEKFTKRLEIQVGAMGQLEAAMKSLQNAQKQDTAPEFTEVFKDIENYKKGIKYYQDKIKEGTVEEIKGLVQDEKNLGKNASIAERSYYNLLRSLKGAREELSGLQKDFNKLDVASAQATVATFMSIGESTGTVDSSMRKELSALIETIGSDELKTWEEFWERFREITTLDNASFNAIKAAETNIRDLDNALLALSGSSSSPFDDTISGAKELARSYKTLEENLEKDPNYEGIDTFTTKIKNANEPLFNLISSLDEDFGKALDKFVSNFEQARNTVKKINTELESVNISIERFKEASEVDPSFITSYYNEVNKGLSLSKAAVEAELDTQKQLLKAAESKNASENDILSIKLKIAKLTSKQQELEMETVSAVEISAKKNIAIAESDKERLQNLTKINALEQESLTLKKSILEASVKAQNLLSTDTSTGEISTEQELSIFKDLKTERMKAIDKELSIKTKMIDAEYDLLKAKFELIEAEVSVMNQDRGSGNQISIPNAEKYLDFLEEQKQLSKENAQQTAKLKRAQLNNRGLELANSLVRENLSLQESLLDAQLSLNSAQKTSVENSATLYEERLKLSQLMETGSSALSAEKELQLFQQYKQQRMELVREEASIKSAQINAEYQLLSKKLEEKLFTTDDSNTEDALVRQLELAERQRDLDLERLQTTLAIQEAQNDTSGLEKQLAVIDETAQKMKDTLSSIGDNEVSNVAKPAIDMFKDLAKQSKSYTKLEEKLAKEREKSALEGALGNINAQKEANERIKELEEDKNKSMLSTGAAMAQGMGSIFTALAETQDKTSKEGFESAKNMQMAAAVVNTAGAIMNALATVQPYPAALAAAAVAAATGAAQISAISSTEFGGSAQAPTMGTVGSASSTGDFGAGGSGSVGTVLGSTEKSQSLKNSEGFLEEIQANQYAELQDIYYEISQLNSNITGLVSGIVRGKGSFDAESLNIEGLGTELNLDVRKYWDEAISWIANPIESFLYKIGGDVGGFIGDLLRIPSDILGEGLDWLGSGLFGKTTTSLQEAGIWVGEIPGGWSSTNLGDIIGGKDILTNYYTETQVKDDGGWFRSSSYDYYKDFELADGLVSDMFTDQFRSIGNTLLEVGESLGTNLQDIKNYDFFNVTDQYGTGGAFIDLKDLSGKEMGEKLQEFFSNVADVAVTTLFEDVLVKYQEVDEAALDTLVRLVGEKEVVLDMFAKTSQSTNRDIIEVSQSIVGFSGDIKSLIDSFGNYYDNFYSTGRKTADSVEHLDKTFQNLRLGMPATREQFIKLIEGLNLNSEWGQEAYARLLKVSEQADAVFSQVENLWDVVAPERSQKARFEEMKDAFKDTFRYFDESIFKSRENMKNFLDSFGSGTRGEELIASISGYSEVLEEWFSVIEEGTSTLNLQTEYLNTIGRSYKATTLEREQLIKDLEWEQKLIQKRLWLAEDYNNSIETIIDAENRLTEARDNSIKQIEDLERKLLESNAAPVQSKEYQETRYDNLLQNVKDADTASEMTTAISELSSFVPSFLDFMSGFGGNYKDIFSSVMDDLDTAKENVSNMPTSVSGMGLEQLLSSINTTNLDLESPLVTTLIPEITGATTEAVQNAILSSMSDTDKLRYGSFGANEFSSLEKLFDFGSNIGNSFSSLISGGLDFSLDSNSEFANALWDILKKGQQGTTYSDRIWNSLQDLFSVGGFYASAFATGGYHSGGWRMVGEQGPEIEYTGSSTITSHSKSQKMLEDAVISAMSTKNDSDNFGSVKVYVGTQEIQDYHIEWHKNDDEVHELVRREAQ